MQKENLLRQDAPLTPDEWNQIDNTVVQVAKSRLVGRRFIDIFGPLGAGVQCYHQDIFAGADTGGVSMLGEEETHPVHAEMRSFVPMPIIFKDFRIYWRDIETTRTFNTPIDTSAAAGAANFVAEAEDNLIFNGNDKLDFQGLMNAKWRNTVEMLNWDDPGQAFQNVVNATRKLVDAGYFGPYAMAVSPNLYSKMQRVYDGTGVLEINQVRELVTAGVYQTPVLKDNDAIVVSTGPQNFDLAIAQDIITAYLGPDNMNHPFRVLESLALRIKRPESICTFESKEQSESRPRKG